MSKTNRQVGHRGRRPGLGRWVDRRTAVIVVTCIALAGCGGGGSASGHGAVSFAAQPITTTAQCQTEVESLAASTAPPPSSASTVALDPSGGADTATAAVAYVESHPLDEQCTDDTLGALEQSVRLLAGFAGSAGISSAMGATPPQMSCTYTTSGASGTATVTATCSGSDSSGSASSGTSSYGVVQASDGKWFVSTFQNAAASASGS